MFVTTHLEYSQRVWLDPNPKKQRSISHAYLYSYLSTGSLMVRARHRWLLCNRSLELELPNLKPNWRAKSPSLDSPLIRHHTLTRFVRPPWIATMEKSITLRLTSGVLARPTTYTNTFNI